ncbi:2-iminoacetate synthase ThiH [Pectinatus haikarae]|uniref:2-iminoacetate synthase n=1 Tax=Pectinatus haikarae TaxID=349096 RepID=A0ABT9Y6U1_9FIRM|nr:2-iminoacetate synthase ThiH [Pectinatus haikarae]MDQ0203539.1 2-iminoacetate synthase [Pectinatus haikarae]
MSAETYLQEKQQYNDLNFTDFLNKVTEEDVLQVLTKNRISRMDFLRLLSPAAQKHLEDMAQRSRRDTIRNFGYTMQLFTPMYIADYCDNLCVYCGFNHNNKISRRCLTMDEIAKEAENITQTGLRNILVLTGESQKYSPVDYILEAVEVLRKYFDSVAIEVYSFSEKDYIRAADTGVDGMTMFQECYDKDIYETLHPGGPKADYEYRLDAPERACRAGIRNVNIGALLGLNEWHEEAFFTGVHADYLQHKYKDTEIAVSTPRMRPCSAGYAPRSIVNDIELVQYITALRIFLPRAGITLSTREKPRMRDHLVKMGITKISGGVTVAVGGHTKGEDDGQFEISDQRSVPQMAQMLYAQGYQPVYKDWQTLI